MVSRNASQYIVETENGTTAVLPVATRSGYNFAGWFDANDNEFGSNSIAEGKVFYAKWEDKTAPSITNVTSTNNTATSQTVTITATDNGSGIDGYYIGTTNPETTTVSYASSNAKSISASGTYYCSVKDKAGNISTVTKTFYKISCDAVSDSGTTSVASVIAMEGNTVTLPTATKTGYSSNGWSTTRGAASGSTTWRATGNVTVYPVWKANQYTVTFNANGGSTSVGSSVVTYGSTYGAGTGGFPTPTRTGYSFNGWYTAPSGGTQIVSQTTVTSATNVTLYAHWTASYIDIVIDCTTGESVYPNISFTYTVNEFASISSVSELSNNIYAVKGDGITSGNEFLYGHTVTYSGNTITVTVQATGVWLRGSISLRVYGN